MTEQEHDDLTVVVTVTDGNDRYQWGVAATRDQLVKGAGPVWLAAKLAFMRALQADAKTRQRVR